MDKIEIGNKISSLRKEKGYTQKQLASKLYVTDRAVSNWERGINLPDLAILDPLAKELDTTIFELLQCDEKTSASKILEMAINERNQFIKEIKIENLILLVFYGFIICYMFYVVVMRNQYNYDIQYHISFLQGFLVRTAWFPFGIALRNHIRIKKYYKVKTK